MKKRLTFISLVIIALLLAGCNLPSNQAAEEPTDESMATEIAKILTGTPVEVLVSPTAETTEDITETEEPTDEAVTEEPTDEVIEDTDTPTPT
ncbi:MAG: hypothetical protein H0S79_26005, partial [Anaerolineaceae bacterium]|nr:hypothetical protein [Anaerolineaceae bacterium]